MSGAKKALPNDVWILLACLVLCVLSLHPTGSLLAANQNSRMPWASTLFWGPTSNLVHLLSSGFDSSPADAPTEQDLLDALERYTKSFDGLSWQSSVDNEYESSQLVSRTQKISVSREGRVRKAETTSIYHDFKVLSGQIASSDGGWSFTANKRITAERGERLSLTVTFFDTSNQYSPLGEIGSLAGFLENLSYANFARQCRTSISRDSLDGVDYWKLDCDHPVGKSASFLFDDALCLRWINWEMSSGDQFDLGRTHLKPRVVPNQQWIRSLNGPISYCDFNGRSVPAEIPYRTDSSESGSDRAGVHQFEDYGEIGASLTDLIAFDLFELPVDPAGERTRVTSQGEEGIRYELRDGKIVKIVDSDALAAAQRARFWRSGKGWARWITLLGVIGAISAGILIWRRQGHDQ